MAEGTLVSRIAAAVLILLGLTLAAGGAYLIFLGGSWYYLLAGIGLIASGAVTLKSRGFGGLIFGADLIFTVVWAVWETGFSFWPLLPRLFGPLFIAFLVLFVLIGAGKARKRALVLVTVGVLAGMTVLGMALNAQFGAGEAQAGVTPLDPVAAEGPSEWRHYGRDEAGARYAPVAQITAANAGELTEAWRFRTGDPPLGKLEDENTPIQAGDGLFLCTPHNRVIALDPDTGHEKWRYDPKLTGSGFHRCRGLAFHEQAAAQGLCARRVLGTNLAAELVALDAETGTLCPGFGAGGKVDLTSGQGADLAERYFHTSSPTVAGDLVIVGGWSPDNLAIAEPSGVVRAFDAVTGRLVWAWNAADGGPPPVLEGPYRRGGPNVWSTTAVDLDLGLVYLPTGNATPDHWASHRSDNAERYSSAVVALELKTGKERWTFQTVRHDVWDYDVAAPPLLADIPNSAGGVTPALIQATKRGQVFVLDRRTGTPLARVEERPVPTNAAEGEWLSPTQPYSVEMPTLGAERLSERKMWGVSPIDQLFCRIDFRSKRYQGDFTPPGTARNIQYPGAAGGSNWGGGAYDPVNHLYVVGDVRLPMTIKLTRSDAPQFALSRSPDRSAKGAGGVPYETTQEFAMSPLGVPCLEPPHGLLTAIDMKTRKIAWRIPVGTAERDGPLGIRSGLRIPLGTASVGGPALTAGGLVFHASTRDPYLRAYDVKTGRKVWQGRLPTASNATPMTFVSGKSGRQFVVVSAGGARNSPDHGDYVVAFALPANCAPAMRGKLDSAGGAPD